MTTLLCCIILICVVLTAWDRTARAEEWGTHDPADARLKFAHRGFHADGIKFQEGKDGAYSEWGRWVYEGAALPMVHINYRKLPRRRFYSTPKPLQDLLERFFSKTLEFSGHARQPDKFNQWTRQSFEVGGIEAKCFGFRLYFGDPGMGADDSIRESWGDQIVFGYYCGRHDVPGVEATITGCIGVERYLEFACRSG